jgi:hypothetical protein
MAKGERHVRMPSAFFPFRQKRKQLGEGLGRQYCTLRSIPSLLGPVIEFDTLFFYFERDLRPLLLRMGINDSYQNTAKSLPVQNSPEKNTYLITACVYITIEGCAADSEVI